MKNKWIIWIFAVVAFIGVIAAAVVGYNYLSARYDEEQVPLQAEESAEEEIQLAPDFTVLNDKGKEVRLEEYFGKPIVLNFWATWCGPCKAELPYFNEAYREHGDEVEFVMVNLTDGVSETVKGVRKFMSQNGYEFPVHFDTRGEAAATYGAYSIPMTIFIDAEGIPRGQYVGVIPEQVLYEQISLLKGE